MPAVAGNRGEPDPAAFGPAQSTARLAALIGPNGQLIRSKNVATVTNPSIGITCIRPTPGMGINVNRIVPSVTVEFSFSDGTDVLAFYNSPEFTDCPSGQIEVLTFDFDGNLSDRVAFTIVVD
jgi:hypothetical protein